MAMRFVGSNPGEALHFYIEAAPPLPFTWTLLCVIAKSYCPKFQDNRLIMMV